MLTHTFTHTNVISHGIITYTEGIAQKPQLILRGSGGGSALIV